MSSRLPLLPSGPGGVCKSTFHGPWRKQCAAGARRLQVETRNHFIALFARRLVKCGSVNGQSQRYEAFASPPDSGGEMVGGEIFVELWKLCFQSGAVRLEIPLNQVVVEFSGNGEQVCSATAGSRT